MKRFYDNPCPVCKKLLNDKDIIVVCPICGTPYHSDCIKEVKECLNVDLHETNANWVSLQELEEKKNQEIKKMYEANLIKQNICSRCSTENAVDDEVCKICGNQLTDTIREENTRDVPQIEYNPFTTPFGGLNPEETIEDVKIKDLAAFIGINSHIYLTKFKMMKINSYTLNLSAMIFNGLYFLYRKMYFVGSIVLLSFIVFSLPNILMTVDSLNILSIKFNIEGLTEINKVFSFLNIALMVFCGFSANKMYKKHCINSIRNIKKTAQPEKEYYKVLRQKGNVNKTIITFLLIIYLMLMFIYTVALVAFS